MSAAGRLPESGQLGGILGLRFGGAIDDLIEQSLLDPLGEFLRRPSKQFRGQLVGLGYRLGAGAAPDGEERRLCDEGASLLEAIHAASLVVDDIEDGSLMRRGEPALHRRHGVPLALNAGNWLYFWPLERVRDWQLDAGRELGIYRVCHRALLRAHFGQALDVGVPVDELPQERVAEVSLASLELKTGALMAMALSIGAVLGRADETRLAALEDFGYRFGVALQMFDDIGNLGRASGTKRFEDLRLRRPSWIWAVAAGEFDPATYTAFVEAVRRFPDTSGLEGWLARHGVVDIAKRRALAHLESSIDRLRAAPPAFDVAAVVALGERLAQSYE